MGLHSGTLFLTLLLLLVLSTLFIAVIGRHYRMMRGLGLWAWGVGLTALCCGALLGRGVLPDTVTITLANALLLGGRALIQAGLCRFYGIPPRTGLLAALVLAVSLPLQFLFDAIDARIVLVSFGLSTLAVMAAHILFIAPGAMTAGRRIAAVVWSVEAGLMGFRAVHAAIGPVLLADGNPGLAAEVFQLWSVASLFMTIVSMTMMVAERLAVDREAALEVQRVAMAEQRDLFAMLSHEFRNPLGVIQATAEGLLLAAGGLPPGAEERITRIRNATGRIGKLIDDCLTEEWLESASQAPDRRPVDLKALVEAVCRDQAALSPDVRIAVSPADRPMRVHGDAALLSIALSNLIVNAVKYASPPEVAVRLTGDGRAARLQVANPGPPIPLDEQARLFDKFFRSGRVGRTPGVGLGLYLVKRIITVHDGSVGVESDPRDGTSFTLVLPLLDVNAP